MESKKEKLVKALNLVIHALKNDTIHYKWTSQSSCNCGVVAQAITGKTKSEIKESFKEVIKGLGRINKEIDKTWKNGVKRLCPITGESTVKIFKELFENGLSKEDIVHLEYMDNPAILERAKIQTYDIKTNTKRVIDTETSKEIVIPHPNMFLRLLGQTKVQVVNEKTYKEVDETYKVNKRYYKEKENLIKYLQAWVSILNEGSRGDEVDNTSIVDLEHELLVAVTNEDYDKAIVLRDKINAL